MQFKEAFLLKTRDEWFDILVEVDVPPAPVYTLEETVGNHYILDRRMLLELDHPKLGTVRQVGIMPPLSEAPGRVRHLGVKPGEHTAEVLSNLGYTQDDID